MIQCVVHGDFNKTLSFLQKVRKLSIEDILKKYAEDGVKALSDATPVRTGKTAASWGYKITKGQNTASIIWTNSNIVDGVCVAVVLNYGHTTPRGGYVEGRHYIEPAIQPIFDKIADAAWKEVTRVR